MSMEQDYTIGELADLAGVTPRTIRYYISIGLLPAPAQVGPRSTYGRGVLQRLRLIRRLQEDHLPLGEIGTRMAGLDDAAVDSALAADQVTPSDSAIEYIRRLRTGQVGPPSATDQPRALAKTLSVPIAPQPRVDPGAIQRTQWERVALSENVELHIRRPLGRLDNKRVERLVRLGREILEEDQP